MFLVWGWRALNAVLGTGQFHCPNCAADTQYRHIRPRRWFTLFFIPVIPLNFLESYIECTRCSRAYREEVLRQPTTGQLQHEFGLANRAAIAHLVSLVPQPGAAVADRASQAIAGSFGVAGD
jgi:hypothetical protein